MFLQFSCIFGPKNLPKTLPKRDLNPSKIDAENVMFFNIVFFRFRPRFWRVLGFQHGAKSAALLAAPGVLDPTAFLLALTYCLDMLRGGQERPKSGGSALMSAPSWAYVGTFFVQIPACWNHAGAFLSSKHASAFTWAFRFSPAACRYVRSTSAASRRDAVRARY